MTFFKTRAKKRLIAHACVREVDSLRSPRLSRRSSRSAGYWLPRLTVTALIREIGLRANSGGDERRRHAGDVSQPEVTSRNVTEVLSACVLAQGRNRRKKYNRRRRPRARAYTVAAYGRAQCKKNDRIFHAPSAASVYATSFYFRCFARPRAIRR